MPKFSIITVCYNSEQTIERTIKSVLAQTFTDFEYIIVDGQSKDSTIEIVKRYHYQFSSIIKYKNEPDKGIYDAMNKGIEMSNGDIIGIVNSDDWLEPDALKNVYSIFEKNNYSLECIYVGGINFHHKNGQIQSILPNLDKFYSYIKTYDMVGVSHPALFFPKHVYDIVGFYDIKIKISADIDFVLRCFYAGMQFIAVPIVLSNMSDGGLSNETSWRNIKRGLDDKIIRMSKYNVNPIKKTYLKCRYIFVGGSKLLIKRLHMYGFFMKIKIRGY